MNFMVEYVRPRNGCCFGCKAAERATKSRKVDLSHLKGFPLRFAPKMRSGVTGNWSDDIWKLNGGNYRFHSDQKNRMCAFLLCRKSKLNLFTLYLSDYKQRF